MKTLAERVRGLDTVFSCGGTVTLPEPIQLRFHGKRSLRIALDTFRAETHLVRRLKKECAPAPFGVGSETHRDPRVRDGKQLLAHDGALAVVGLGLVATGILEEVRRALCPGDKGLPDAELLRQQTTRIYEWETHDRFRHDTPYALKWAAFYGDVDHEIEAVTGGTRATLTWLLRSAEGDVVTLPPPAATELDLETTIRDALMDATFLTQGGTLGVSCMHLYTESEDFVRPADAMSKDAISGLKGRDRQVAFAATRAGLHVRYCSYLYESCAYGAWRLSRAPTAREARSSSNGGWAPRSLRAPYRSSATSPPGRPKTT